MFRNQRIETYRYNFEWLKSSKQDPYKGNDESHIGNGEDRANEMIYGLIPLT
ncbi:hypothetical protein HORM4_200024 [Vibrio harveyi]|nr:hypothetical protein HORM4_200024 [Vibrio harveyi]